MSTRKGIFVSVDDLIDEAVSRARKELDERRPDLSDEELNNISEEIGIGAIRFYIARLSPEKPITFKWDEALSFERGCASIQYAHARACKLLNKADGNEYEMEGNWVPDDIEKDLIRNLAKFPEVIENSADLRRVHPIAQYCQDLANAFNKYDLAEDMGYRIQRFEPHAIESGSVIRWIKSQLERIEDGTDQTIPTDGSH